MGVCLSRIRYLSRGRALSEAFPAGLTRRACIRSPRSMLFLVLAEPTHRDNVVSAI